MAFWDFQDTRYTQARTWTIISLIAILLAGGGLGTLAVLYNRKASAMYVPSPESAASPVSAPVLPVQPGKSPYDLAMAAIAAKKFLEAETYLKQSIASGNRPDECRSFLGVILKENGKYQEAIDILSQSIAENPEANRYFNRGECYEAMGETAKATADFDLAVEKAPSNSLFTNKRYLFLIRSGRQSEVEDAINLQMSLGVTSNNDEWVMAAAAIALQQGKPEIAATILKGATRLLTRQNFDYLLRDPLFESHRMDANIRQFYGS